MEPFDWQAQGPKIPALPCERSVNSNLGGEFFGFISDFDQDRCFYPTILIVIALYYVPFAVMEASLLVLLLEILVACGFTQLAVLGGRQNDRGFQLKHDSGFDPVKNDWCKVKTIGVKTSARPT